ncbi:iron-sulfur cluster assembly scaffold protein [Oceanibium sediminis]|uniref:iron-sulfur cluster assembly scaffold protein n=1 Tax=Oceanibium sediminis TaxID=2026339 RepID=UPI000DD37485|nr:iron-sulfur cluster assembly scaffold protein [Oceanibium sediminis]
MSGEADLIKLYSQRILALSADIPHQAPLALPQAEAKKRSPLCGSTVSVALSLKDGRISEYAQDVKACALGQASAAISGAVIIGLTRDEVARGRDQLKAMLKSGGPVPDAPFDGFEVLEPARDYKNRHASIMLTLDATLDAFDKALEAAA